MTEQMAQVQALADLQAQIINDKNDAIARLTDTLADVAVAMWESGDECMAEWACALEGIVKRYDPAFSIAGAQAAALPTNEESALYACALLAENAGALVLDCSPADTGAKGPLD
jgi:hypothetical protein